MDHELTPEEREALLREMLFVPCETKEHLHTWVKAYLGLDLPGSTVCHTDTDFEASNSNPLELLWEIYSAARSGDRKKSRFLYYAARGCYKSVLASVVEALCMFHLRRDVGHMAANKKQSKIVQEYLANYLRRPVLRDYMTSKNESEISVTWYERDGAILTPAQYNEIAKETPELTRGFVEKRYQTTVIVATLGGSNGLHCSMMVMDELDLTSEDIISEAMMIPNPGKEAAEHPMVLMTSSRKFALGPVQNAIDSAHKTGIHVRHWNVIDVTRACPSERHLPMLPKIDVHYSNETLETITEDQFKELTEDDQKKFQNDKAYQGCIQNCRMFAMCRGRLATEQHSETPLLRDVDFTQDLFMSMTDVEKAQAQLMCWKPSREGMVYPRLSRLRHLIKPYQIAEMLTGDSYPTSFSKNDLLHFFSSHDVSYFVGVDHGFNHCFAGVLGVKWGSTIFIIDAFEIPGLELDGKIKIMKSRFSRFSPAVFADTSHPGDNKSIARSGFNVRKWQKGPGSVVDGIGVVRMKLNPVLSNRPELFFLAGDTGVESLFQRLLRYAWVIDASSGEPTDQPNEKDDDGCDALRYCVMNVFAPKGHVIAGKEEERNPLTMPRENVRQEQVAQQHWEQIKAFAGIGEDEKGIPGEYDTPSKNKGKKGNFVWDLS